MDSILSAAEAVGLVDSAATTHLLIVNHHLLSMGGIGAELIGGEMAILRVRTTEVLTEKTATSVSGRSIKKRSINNKSKAETAPVSNVPVWTWYLEDGTAVRYSSPVNPDIEGIVPFWKRAKRSGPFIVTPLPRLNN